VTRRHAVRHAAGGARRGCELLALGGEPGAAPLHEAPGEERGDDEKEDEEDDGQRDAGNLV